MVKNPNSLDVQFAPIAKYCSEELLGIDPTFESCFIEYSHVKY